MAAGVQLRQIKNVRIHLWAVEIGDDFTFGDSQAAFPVFI